MQSVKFALITATLARIADPGFDRDFRVQIAAFFLTIRHSEFFVIRSFYERIARETSESNEYQIATVNNSTGFLHA